MPTLPTMAEEGFPGAEWDSWLGLGAPASTPPVILDKMNRDLREILAAPENREHLLKLGIEVRPDTRAAMNQVIKEELER